MKTKTNNKVDIYRRLLKYPPFSVSRRAGAMTIKHTLKEGEITATCIEYVTSEDAEKLYALCYVAEKNKTYKIIKTEKFDAIAELTTNIWEIRKLTNCNDDMYIYKALDKITGIKISYNFEKKKSSTHIIHAVKFNQATGEINVLMPLQMFKNFQIKSLSIDIEKYSKLTATAKNLYGYLATNSGEIFTENLLIERTTIQAKRKDNAQKLLKTALNELKAEHIIKDFKITKKDGERQIIVDKFNAKTNIHNGRKNLSITVGKTETKNPANTSGSKD